MGIRRLAQNWRDIASDKEAAPTGTMLRAINVLLQRVANAQRLLRDIRPHLHALSVTDDDPEFKTLLKRLDEELVDGYWSKPRRG
jgi:hypothetical protein